jgi:hypothetical protein
MARSLHRTLAVRHSLTMAVALLGMGLWVDRGVRQVLLEVTDRAIQTTYQLQALSLLRGPSRSDRTGSLRE